MEQDLLRRSLRIVKATKAKNEKKTRAAMEKLVLPKLGLHALFMGEDDSWEAAVAVDASGISAILGLQGSGVKLRHGFAPSDSVNSTQDELRQRKEKKLNDYALQVSV